MLDAPNSGGVTLNELNILSKLRNVLGKVVVVYGQSLKQPIWGDRASNVSHCVCVDTHGDLVYTISEVDSELWDVPNLGSLARYL